MLKTVKEFIQWKIKYRDNCSKPIIIDNVSGNDNIANLFKDKYSKYSEENCLNERCSNNHKITVLDLKVAIEKLKKNKQDYVYSICSENIFYVSDNILFLILNYSTICSLTDGIHAMSAWISN